MKPVLHKLSGPEWEHLAAAQAHRAVFSEVMPPGYDRIDFALLAIDPKLDHPVAYLTARETDKESVYLKHGGAFDPLRATFNSYSVYLAMIGWMQERYKRITTLVENTNRVYLKLAISAGFQIIGIRNFNGSVLVELFLEGST